MRRALGVRVFVAVAGVVAAPVLAVGLSSPSLSPSSVALAAAFAGIGAGALVASLSLRWMDAAVSPIADAARRMAAGDLSARTRVDAEDDIGELGARLDRVAAELSRTVGGLEGERDLVSHILAGMQEGVLLLDEDGRVALMNPALREMLLPRGEVLGRPVLDVIRDPELKDLLDRARETQAPCSGEVELEGLTPRRLLVRATSFTQHTSGLLAVFFDVTDIRRLESLRRDFVANVSHELRTPVTALLSAAETLDLALGKDPEGARRFLGIIERNAARLERLIEDLLDLSRIESRAMKLRPERFEFGPFATHLVGLFRERAEEKNITIAVEREGPIELFCDRRALEQVLINLVDNAVKYCFDGCAVVLRAERVDASARVFVVDDGPGIANKHMGRLFERFYRVDAGRSREMGGTGLGLSICKHLVEAMGGSIGVTSADGKGTSFELRIPDAKGPAQPSSPDAEGAAA